MCFDSRFIFELALYGVKKYFPLESGAFHLMNEFKVPGTACIY